VVDVVEVDVVEVDVVEVDALVASLISRLCNT